jgi:hypothetical protein
MHTINKTFKVPILRDIFQPLRCQQLHHEMNWTVYWSLPHAQAARNSVSDDCKTNGSAYYAQNAPFKCMSQYISFVVLYIETNDLNLLNYSYYY